MYFEPWQVFLVGCIVGTLISFIVLTIIIINTIGRVGLRSITVHHPSIDDDEDDINAKLSYVLFTKGFISQADIDFMLEKISFEDWQKALTDEIKDEEKDNED